jgi:hypothetical protein
LFRAGDLDLTRSFSGSLLGLFGGLESIGAFRLQARVLEALALGMAVGSSEDSAPGTWADIRMTGIGMSPSNPRMGKIKLSKSCIQEIKI